jgi:hypothetical protein
MAKYNIKILFFFFTYFIKIFNIENNLTEGFELSDCYRFNFVKLTDFFGRIIIYKFDLYGSS